MADIQPDPLGHHDTKMRDMLISMPIASIVSSPSTKQSFHWSSFWQVLDGWRTEAANFEMLTKIIIIIIFDDNIW